MDDKANYYFTESTAEFKKHEVESTPIGDFDFSLLAPPWSSEGQTPDYLFVVHRLSSRRSRIGLLKKPFCWMGSSELQLTLPESVNPFLDHRFKSLQSANTGRLPLNTTNCKAYQNFRIWRCTSIQPIQRLAMSLMLSNWLSFRYRLLMKQTRQPSPIPQSVFYISVETVDGTVHDTVNPLPMRTDFEFKDSLVVGEEAEFEWRLEGIYLNQMDNIQKIDVVSDKQLGSSRTRVEENWFSFRNQSTMTRRYSD